MIRFLLALSALACGDDAAPLDASHDGGPRDAPDAGGEARDASLGLRIPGLSAVTTVYTDEHGVPHVECETDTDCLAALGYLHARSRFFQMDTSRRYARGTLATLTGMFSIESDRTIRRYFSTGQGVPIEEAMLADLSTDTVALLEAYTAGVNAWLADLRAGRNGARASEEYGYRVAGTGLLREDVLETIPDWEVLDSLAIYVSVAQSNGDNAVEPSLTTPMTRLSAEVFRDLFLPIPLGGSSILADGRGGSSARAFDVAAIRETQRRLRRAGIDGWAEPAFADAMRAPIDRTGGMGSNSWAIASSFTSTGEAIFANDPHGTMRNPAPSFVAAIESGESLTVMGASVPGLPLFVIGENEDAAWGCTVSFADATDYYYETLAAGAESTMFRGAEIPIVERDVTFQVAGGVPVTETFRFVPHHGPIVFEDPSAGRAVTVRWNAAGATTDVDALFALARADGLEQATDAIERVGALGCNVTLAARDGRIAWRVATAIPRRAWASPALAPWLPLPGDGSAEWDGTLSPDERPHLDAPAAGYVASANNAFAADWADGDPTNDGHPYWEANPVSDLRHLRIAEVLERERGAHSPEDSSALQADVQALGARAIAPGIVREADAHAPSLDARASALIEILRGWELGCPSGLASSDPSSVPNPETRVEARGCLVHHHVFTALGERVLLDELTEAGLEAAYNPYFAERFLWLAFERPDSLLTGDALFDDVGTAEVETRWDAIEAALATAASVIETNLGADPAGWLWGRVHTVRLPSVFSRPAWDLGPFANDGALTSVDPAGGAFTATGAFMQTHGAHLRMVIALGERRSRMTLELAGGNDLHRDSPFYSNMLERYLRNEPVEIAFELADVIAAGPAIERFTP
jgi:penicillin G amidase